MMYDREKSDPAIVAVKPTNKAVALANKMARIAWALLAKGGTYRAPGLAPVLAAAA